MSKLKDITRLTEHKEQALLTVQNYIDGLINVSDENDSAGSRKKADLICYWLKDYIRFLSLEKDFDPQNLKRYKRGEIVKVHLGFRIGSEEGGLHYAVVLDTNNPRSSPTLTVVPLTSVKEGKDLKNLPTGSVYLGDELYNALDAKIKTLINDANKELREIVSDVKKDNQYFDSDEAEILKRFKKVKKNIKLLEKSEKEIYKMKRGSIALTNQIVTVSKLRIYDPKSSYDVLSGIKLSNDNLDKIDRKILCNYTKTN